MLDRWLRALTGLGGLAFVAGCAAPVAGLWPPPSGTATVPVHVSVDTWHAMIALPAEDRAGAKFEEWGYAQRAWYLEGRQGAFDAVRALFWPTEGVVEVTLADRLWAERTPQPPAEVFTFELAPEGHRRLRAHLAATRAGSEPVAVLGPARFYPARDAYHLFHTCHVWAARALRAAGLPLSPGVALTRSALVHQLERAAHPAPGSDLALRHSHNLRPSPACKAAGCRASPRSPKVGVLHFKI